MRPKLGARNSSQITCLGSRVCISCPPESPWSRRESNPETPKNCWTLQVLYVGTLPHTGSGHLSPSLLRGGGENELRQLQQAPPPQDIGPGKTGFPSKRHLPSRPGWCLRFCPGTTQNHAVPGHRELKCRPRKHRFSLSLGMPFLAVFHRPQELLPLGLAPSSQDVKHHMTVWA